MTQCSNDALCTPDWGRGLQVKRYPASVELETNMKADRSKKTTRRKYLVTLWTHPDADQTLVQHGNKRATRQVARETLIGDSGDPKKMRGVEEYWSNEEINNLGEYEG